MAFETDGANFKMQTFDYEEEVDEELWSDSTSNARPGLGGGWEACREPWDPWEPWEWDPANMAFYEYFWSDVIVRKDLQRVALASRLGTRVRDAVAAFLVNLAAPQHGRPVDKAQLLVPSSSRPRPPVPLEG